MLFSGATHRVFNVADAPLIGYSRDQGGALGDVLQRLLERNQVLDLFGFTGAAMLPGLPRSSTVEATVCHYDREDQLVERVVTDLGALLASLEPVPDSIPNGCMKHYPPIRIIGDRYEDVRSGVLVDTPLPAAACGGLPWHPFRHLVPVGLRLGAPRG